MSEVADSETMPFEDGGLPDEVKRAVTFMQAALSTSDLRGACVVETFTCTGCKTQQRTIHGWTETLKCGKCGHSNKSRVPRLPAEGEITADDLIQAIHLVRQTLPTVPEGARDFCLKQDGAIRTVATTLAVSEAHRVLNLVQDVARKLSGGHQK